MNYEIPEVLLVGNIFSPTIAWIKRVISTISFRLYVNNEIQERKKLKITFIEHSFVSECSISFDTRYSPNVAIVDEFFLLLISIKSIKLNVSNLYKNNRKLAKICLDNDYLRV